MTSTARLPTRPPRRLSADHRREQILQAAAQLFIERGFERVSMADLGAHLQTSRATIYTYFPSTEAILDALFQDRLRSIQARLHPHVSGEPRLSRELLVLLLREHDTVQLLNSGGGPQFRHQRQQILHVLRTWIMAELPGPLPPPQREWLLNLIIEVVLAVANEDTARHEQWPALERFVEGGLQAIRSVPVLEVSR